MPKPSTRSATSGAPAARRFKRGGETVEVSLMQKQQAEERKPPAASPLKLLDLTLTGEVAPSSDEEGEIDPYQTTKADDDQLVTAYDKWMDHPVPAPDVLANAAFFADYQWQGDDVSIQHMGNNKPASINLKEIDAELILSGVYEEHPPQLECPGVALASDRPIPCGIGVKQLNNETRDLALETRQPALQGENIMRGYNMNSVHIDELCLLDHARRCMVIHALIVNLKNHVPGSMPSSKTFYKSVNPTGPAAEALRKIVGHNFPIQGGVSINGSLRYSNPQLLANQGVLETLRSIIAGYTRATNSNK